MNASRLAMLIAKAVQAEPRNVADDDTINIAKTNTPSKESGGTAKSKTSAKRPQLRLAIA